MGCTVREKHIKTSRRSRKPTNVEVDHNNPNQNVNNNNQSVSDDRNHRMSEFAKSLLESGEFKPWNINLGGLNDSCMQKGVSVSSNPNDPNAGWTQNPNPNPGGFDDCGWGYCTEEQLEEILLKQLEYLYNEALSKLVALGYDEEVALKAVLKNGHCYGGMDVLSNIIHNTLGYLRSGCSGDDERYEESELVFNDLRQLEDYSLAGMTCLLQQLRPSLTRGDALWCLLMSDLHVGRASTIEFPKFRSANNVCGNAISNMECPADTDPNSSGISVNPGLCKFHGGWGFGSGANMELPGNGSGGFSSYSNPSIQKDIDCARFNLSPAMNSLLKKNVAAFAAGFRSTQELQMQSQPCTSSVDNADPSKVAVPSEQRAETDDSNQDIVNSLLNKFQDLNLDENLDSVTDDQKDQIMLTLLHQVKDLEKQLVERKEWAHQKAMQAARKLTSDLTELKMLRTEREETQRLKKGKQTLEDTTMKRLSEMENALRKASSQVDRANAAVRQLETENAEIRAEMEASKLSASESVTTCMEVAKREKKCLKRLTAWEKQKAKLQEEISVEKQKIADLQQQMVQILASQKEAEAKWKREVKEKEAAMAQVEEERRSKEATESNNKRKLESLRLRIEIDFQRNKDDLQRLEQELSRLKANAQPPRPPPSEPKDECEPYVSGSPITANEQRESIARLLRELDEADEGSDRKCLICMEEEVGVVFLPCAHQIMCATCGEGYGKKGKATTCPCCDTLIEQRIRVFGASS